MQTIVLVPTNGRGCFDVTAEINRLVQQSRVRAGLCNVFIQHTSASLLIQENADASVRRDLERWLAKLAPESSEYEHDDEGPDDMPAHIRSVLTGVHLSIPIVGGKLALGTWQGIYLWEHRLRPHDRTVVVHIKA